MLSDFIISSVSGRVAHAIIARAGAVFGPRHKGNTCNAGEYKAFSGLDPEAMAVR